MKDFGSPLLLACALSRVWLFVILWTGVYQASLSMGFFKQEYWSGLLFSSPGDLPHPGEGMKLKLKLQYFGHLMWRVDSLEKTLMLEGIGGRRRRGRLRMRWLDGITDLMDVSLSELPWMEEPGRLQSMGSQRVGHNWATELNWTELRVKHDVL